MTAEQFTMWLQGFIEMNPNAMITHTQWLILKDHLKLVFDKKTPDRVTTHRVTTPFPNLNWPGPADLNQKVIC